MNILFIHSSVQRHLAWFFLAVIITTLSFENSGVWKAADEVGRYLSFRR